MPSDNFIKNLTSKDINIAQNAIKDLIKSNDIKDFQKLCDRADFIFPFLKEKIINNFVKLINKEDLKTVFEFTKVYCCDFEDMIVKSWLKYADEDLTDEILDLFEYGTVEQKAYCAKYFCRIKDTLAYDLLKKYALSNYEPLRLNCATALFGFGDIEISDKMREIILNSSDEFEKEKACSYLCAYNIEGNIDFIIKNLIDSPLILNIIADIFDFCDFEVIKKNLDILTIERIFQVLAEGYPENITLDTIKYYQIYDFIELIEKENNQYANNLLLNIKLKFNEYHNNDIYLYDLDKNLKDELEKIVSHLNNLNLEKNMSDELKLYNTAPYRFNLAIENIKNYKLDEYCSDIADLINGNYLKEEAIALCADALNELKKINLIDEKIARNIDNDNVRALILSYL